MCLSWVGQLMYGVVMFAALVLTLVALFTPGWRNVDRTDGQTPTSLNYFTDRGLLSSFCRNPGMDGADCGYWWNSQPVWNRCVVVSLALAVIIEGIALIWNLFACFACCGRRYLLHPLVVLALIASILLAIAVGVFGTNNRYYIDNFRGLDTNNRDSYLGYSFYLACAALACAILDIILGVLAACCAVRVN